MYQEFVVIPLCARQHPKDSGHTEAKMTPVFGGDHGPMGETDKETNNYRAMGTSM